jgi:mono/diheme cytochrome c family protein
MSACGSGKLADELTPVPTLAPGQEPTLISALPSSESAGEATEEAVSSGEETEGAATEEAAANGEAAAGDAAVGEQIFTEMCTGCHGEEDSATAPTLTGISERAATRIEGMSAEDYIHQSIVDPSAYVVEGHGDIMPKDYEEQLSEEEINGLVQYLLTK